MSDDNNSDKKQETGHSTATLFTAAGAAAVAGFIAGVAADHRLQDRGEEGVKQWVTHIDPNATAKYKFELPASIPLSFFSTGYDKWLSNPQNIVEHLLLNGTTEEKIAMAKLPRDKDGHIMQDALLFRCVKHIRRNGENASTVIDVTPANLGEVARDIYIYHSYAGSRDADGYLTARGSLDFRR